ncbi:hypothetical protein ACOSP7_020717 [Xanthoceras sorbifolium]|uniref:Fe2OG dioxygenase domain-containing protein n=1 Tax=Xanthoceras sorbifolium TaxID=99658 RepID=A0ABQ8HLB0_9ROSI|nr:hypothetical protein JRO89_XS09G0142700 [Xanthoceras sorbifolium]
MGSQSQSRIPVIDLSNEELKPGTKTWVSTCKEIRHALEEFGCFEAIYSKVSMELHNQVFETTKELFDLPTETKMKNKSSKPYFHYLGQYSNLPLYESLGIDNPTTLDSTQSFTNLMWSSGNDRFCENALSYSDLVGKLDKWVIRMLFESYGVGRCYESYTESVHYLLRCVKYRAPDMNETTTGLTPHTDKTMISIIHQNHINGLQIKTRDSEWIEFEPSAPSSFVVMAGDALMAWSNDRILPCYHQVIMSHSTETRYSLAMFSFSSGIVEIPQELGDDKNPLKYKPFDHFEFLHFLQSLAGKEPPSKPTVASVASETTYYTRSIKAYCGI